MPELVFSARRQRQRCQEASDQELLERLANGQEEALDQLVSRKTEPLVKSVTRILGDVEEARDVVQMAFLRLWENRRRYDSRWAPNTWIYRIATNLAIDQLRSRKSRDRSSEPLRWHLEKVADTHPRPMNELQGREVHAIFEQLSRGLSDKQRLVFVLKEVEGRTSEEVAAILGCRPSTVRNHLFNARKTLQRALRERFPEYAQKGDR